MELNLLAKCMSMEPVLLDESVFSDELMHPNIYKDDQLESSWVKVGQFVLSMACSNY